MAQNLEPDWLSDENKENRGERRRALYLGERVNCLVHHGLHRYRAEIVDMSPQGLALISSRKTVRLPFQVGDMIKLEFSKHTPTWSLNATVANIGEMTVQKESRQRIGIKFELNNCTRYNQFSEAVGEELIGCKTYIRPQISCPDPFFYKEIIMFQCNGFTARGIDLVCSSRWKSILPGQYLNLKVYVPGAGEFEIQCKNSNNFYQSKWKDRFRIYMEYVEASAEFQHAVCEYLIMMQNDVTPLILRKSGFRFKNFDKACYLEKSSYSSRLFPIQEFIPSVLAAPEKDRPFLQDIKQLSRELCCKLGANRVAYFNLVFFDGNKIGTKLHRLQEPIPHEIAWENHIYLTNLIVSNKAALSDFLIPMLQQAIRIAAQAKGKHLIFSAEDGLLPILKKIGFRQIGIISKGKELDPGFRLMALEINSVLANQHLLIESNIWNKVYSELNQFLGRNPPRKNADVMSYKFPKK